jgi:hypothetical protein
LLCKLCLKPCKTYSLEEKFYTKEDIVALEINDGVCPSIVNFPSLKELVMRKEGNGKVISDTARTNPRD